MHKKSIGLYYSIIWIVYLVTSPIYIFPKGLPQPADIFLICGVLPATAVAILNFRGTISNVQILGGLFVALSIATNIANYVFFPDTRFLLSSMYYLYNFLVFGFAVYLFKQDSEQCKKITYAAIILAITIQFFWIVFFPDKSSWRATGGFLNPNQLAYWSLLTAVMIVFLKRYESFNWLDVVAFLMLGIMQGQALSKAGLLTFGSVVLFMVFLPNMPRPGRIIFFMLALLASMYLLMNPQKVTSALDTAESVKRVVERIENIGQENDDNLEGRGYNRIVNHPEYIILGAGEGAFYRFRTSGSSNELHSGLATLLFSYGITGFTIFFGFIVLLFYRQPVLYSAFIIPIIAYGAVHQNIRFTHFWVLLGIAYGSYCYREGAAFLKPGMVSLFKKKVDRRPVP